VGVAAGEAVAQALWYVGPGRAEIRPERLSPLAAGHVRVRAIYSAISRGTEALIAAGRVPESEYQRMRAPFMGGSFPFPVKYGYAAVGVVEAGPEALVGQNVFALYPHQTRFDLPAEAVVLLPADIPLPRAVLAANVETALNATWDAAPGPSGRIVVVGAGVVGALVGFLCGRIEGAEVTLIDIDPAREALTSLLGDTYRVLAESLAVARDVQVGELTNCRLHIADSRRIVPKHISIDVCNWEIQKYLDSFRFASSLNDLPRKIQTVWIEHTQRASEFLVSNCWENMFQQKIVAIAFKNVNILAISGHIAQSGGL